MMDKYERFMNRKPLMRREPVENSVLSVLKAWNEHRCSGRDVKYLSVETGHSERHIRDALHSLAKEAKVFIVGHRNHGALSWSVETKVQLLERIDKKYPRDPTKRIRAGVALLLSMANIDSLNDLSEEELRRAVTWIEGEIGT